MRSDRTSSYVRHAEMTRMQSTGPMSRRIPEGTRSQVSAYMRILCTYLRADILLGACPTFMRVGAYEHVDSSR